MGILYSPLLVVTAFLEVREARRIRWNRRRGEDDDDYLQEWEHAAEQVGFEVDEDWRRVVGDSAPEVHVDPCRMEIAHLREQVREMAGVVRALVEEKRGGSGSGLGMGSNGESCSTIAEREDSR